ncbi:hypothetical protein SETIT_5G228700v2 [Setaria italica]|uniref:BLE2 protein n=1 Tax=Setaria italica TaxID=4555 RepID=K3XE71_SETIT|nr:uncharacterized protein LOC101773272 [Setaria italica]RCV26227.1 hypothetical protein SETIT_5G228700v2 [Setaria italica]
MAGAVADPNHHSIAVTAPDQPQGSTAVEPPWLAAQRCLNRFVRTVALLERAGNGLGTLAFTWATVVILGGFSTNLGPDFWYATAIVFLEAFRVFSRESRSDDELLFKTTGSIRLKRVKLIGNVPYYLNVGIVMVSLYGTIEFLLVHYKYLPQPPHRMPYHFVLLAVLLALGSMVQLPTIVKYMKKGHPLLQASPLVAVLAFGGVLLWTNAPARFAALVVAPLFVGCLHSLIAACLKKTEILPHIPKLLQKFGSLIFPVWIAISVPIAFRSMGILILLGTLLVGNIQIPMALARIGLSLMRLSSKESHKVVPGGENNNEHLAPALRIFYSMVLGQGTLYILACLCESVLFHFLRGYLARALGDVKEGFESVDMYYEHAYDKCMEDGVLAQEDLHLVRFAVDSLNSNSRNRKLAAVQILHSLLLPREASNKLPDSDRTTCTKAVVTLISMLRWTGPDDQIIRFFAAKIAAELAGDLLIVGIPGTIQMVSSLLDSDAKNSLVKQSNSAQIVDNNEQSNDNGQLIISHDSATTVDMKGVEVPYQTVKIIKDYSAHAEANSKWWCKTWKFLLSVKGMLSVPKEGKEPWTDEDSFPVQGMIILEKLTHNPDNCAEINRAAGLIPKIIGFMSYTNTNATNISKARQKLCITSALKLIAKLVSTEGEIGLALRQKISEQAFLLSNLAEILEDSHTGMDQQLTMVIISKLALDDETRHEIGSFQLFITKLMHVFLGRDGSTNTYYDCSLRMVAAEALSNLSMENPANCSSILEETRYDLIDNLKKMILNDEFACFAESLLENLCSHSRNKLQQQESREHLSSALQGVLVKMMVAEGKQLEFLIGLASQIYTVIPESFAHKLESHANATGLVQKLVVTLNSNKKPSHEYPRMRRVVVEMIISVVVSCPHCAIIFREQGMMEALTKVERTPSKVEKYRVFFGDTGVVLERGLPLRDLVARAKGLIDPSTPTPGAQLL